MKEQNLFLLNSSILGYAHHKIIVDEAGVPRDYEFLEINETFEKITGLKAKDIVGRTVRAAIPGIEHAEFDWIGCYGAIALGGGAREFEQYNEQLGRWYRVHAYSSERLFFTTLFIDITPWKKQAEELEGFFTVNLDLLCIADLSGNFLKVNQAWTHVLGHSSEELVGRKFLEFIHPDDLEPTLDAMAALGNGQDVLNFTNRYRCRDGSYRHIEWRSHPVGNLIYAAARDITERINSEESLKASEANFRDFFESMEDMVVVASPNGQVLYANESAIRKLGYAPDKLDTSGIVDLYPSTRRKEVQEFFAAVIQGARSTTQLPLERRDGSLIPAETHMSFGRWNSKACILCVIKDLTKERLAQETQKQQALYLTSIIENQPGLVWLKDSKSRFLAVNTAFAASCGQNSPSIVVGRDDLDVWPKELAEKYRADDAEVMASGAPKTTEELIADRGEQRWFETFKSPVRDEAGKVVGTTGYARDITERKQAEERLLQRERELRESLAQVELFRSLVESSGDCFYLVDLDDGCRMVYVNEASVRHYGAPREELYRWHIPDWDPSHTEETLPQLVAMIEERKCLHLESRHRIADGSIVPVEITVNYMKGADGRRLAFGWFSNISTRLAAEAELQNAKRQAEAASKAKSEFLANMSHEIRTPLNGVIGFTELLKSTPLGPLQRQYVENANVSGHALLGIINDILDFSKIEAGMMNLEAIRTDMVELLQGAIDIVKFSAGKKRLEVLLDIDPAMHRYAVVDPVRLKQILANLLGNAIKFTERGEVELKVVFERLTGTQGRFRISVRDTGIGIAVEQREKLFKAFSQADSSTTRKFGGTGLGLIISEMIAKKMGSAIHVDSAPGKGATFFFDIVAETEAGPQKDNAALRGVKRCLVIDDNANSRLGLERMLGPWGVSVVSYDNGLSAVAQLDVSQPFDVIICDCDMPSPDGLETIRRMGAKLGVPPAKLPVILLHSASDDLELHRKLDELGVMFRMAKPVKAEELWSTLCRIREPAVATEAETPVAENRLADTTSPVDVTICIVEDVAINMMLVRIIVEGLFPQGRILEASNGLAAVEIVKKERPDLILMDVQMPGMDGLEATRAIRALEKETGGHVPIIALTAGAFKEEQERCLGAGMDAFLTKPIESESLTEVLNRICAPLCKRA